MVEEQGPTIAKAASKAALSFIASFVCFFFLYALLRKKKIRKSSYNVYIIFLILPDAVVNLTSHGLFNMFVALNGGTNWFPPGYYYVDVWSWFFYYYSNCFLNGIVAFEISRMLHRSHARKRTDPPSLSRVYKQVAAAYTLAALMSLLFVVPVPFALYTITDNQKGSADLGGEIFDEMTAMAIGFGIMLVPMFYVIFVRIQMWRKKLLPKSGKTRALSLFFMRIIIVYFLFYIPNTTLTAFLQDLPGSPKVKFWVSAVMGILTAAQAFVNVYLIYYKDDICVAVNEAWDVTFGRCCCACGGEAERRQDKNSSPVSSQVQISGLSYPLGKESSEPQSNSLDQTESMSVRRSNVWQEPDLYESEVEDKDTQKSDAAPIMSQSIGVQDSSSTSHQARPSSEVVLNSILDDGVLGGCST